ncbi:hypothetical protein JOB18_044302, partial [Solea senegalensis]
SDGGPIAFAADEDTMNTIIGNNGVRFRATSKLFCVNHNIHTANCSLPKPVKKLPATLTGTVSSSGLTHSVNTHTIHIPSSNGCFLPSQE